MKQYSNEKDEEVNDAIVVETAIPPNLAIL